MAELTDLTAPRKIEPNALIGAKSETPHCASKPDLRHNVNSFRDPARAKGYFPWESADDPAGAGVGAAGRQAARS